MGRDEFLGIAVNPGKPLILEARKFCAIGKSEAKGKLSGLNHNEASDRCQFTAHHSAIAGCNPDP